VGARRFSRVVTTAATSAVLKLALFADFGEAFFPFALVGQRIGVVAPEFFHHFTLRHERALGFGSLVNVVKRAPAFRVGFSVHSGCNATSQLATKRRHRRAKCGLGFHTACINDLNIRNGSVKPLQRAG